MTRSEGVSDELLRAVTVGLQSADASVRSQAESALEVMKSSPKQFAESILRNISTGVDPSSEQMLAVLLRQTLQVNAKDKSMVDLRPQLLIVLAQLSDRLSPAAYKGVLHAVCALIKRGCTWNELIPAILHLGSSSNSLQRLAALMILDKLAEFNFEIVSPHLNAITPILGEGLSGPHSTADTRQAAMRASISLLVSFPDDHATVLANAGLLPLLLQTIQACESETDLKSTLTNLIELVGYKAPLFERFIPQICMAMEAIMRSPQLDQNCRSMSLEVLVSLSNGRVNKQGVLGGASIELALELMASGIVSSSADETLSAEDIDEFASAGDALFRLCQSVGIDTVMKIAIPRLSSWISEGHMLPALHAAKKITEGCPERLAEKFGSCVWADFVSWSKIGLRRQEESIRVAALQLLSAMCMSASGKFQESAASHEIPSICVTMMSDPSPAVVEEACLCLASFCVIGEEWDREISERSLQALCSVLDSSPAPAVADAALTAISSLSEVLGEKFVQFYDRLMPALLALCASESQARGKAIECAGILGHSVGSHIFAKDAAGLTQLLLQLNLPSNHDDWPFVHQALARICQTMGAEFFSPFLPAIIPHLLSCTALDDGCSVEEVTDERPVDDVDGVDVVTLEVRGLGKRMITMNTFLMEQKSLACNMLFQYAHDLGPAFRPWAVKTAASLIPLINCRYNEQVRLAAAAALPPIVSALFPSNEAVECARQAYPNLISAIASEPELCNLMAVVEACADTIKALKNETIGIDLESKLCVALELLLAESAARRDERAASLHGGQCDDHEISRIDEENDVETEIQGHIVDVVSACAQSSRDLFLPVFQSTLERRVCSMLTRSLSELTSALCIFDDVIEHCSPKAAELYVVPMLPVFLEHASSTDSDVCQAAVYGLGVCAHVCSLYPSLRTLFSRDYMHHAYSTLRQVVHSIDLSKDEAFALSRDNAISSMGKMLVYQRALWSPAELPKAAAEWVSLLPVRNCPIESKVVHGLLLQVISLVPDFLKPHSPISSHLMFVIANVIADRLANDEVLGQLRSVWHQERLSGNNVVSAVLSQLTPEQRSLLQ
ncbi:Importin N-terminal domain-containing protein [Plasmodiophora brassicae]|nr:hypothetical protein PBRA_005943 [Plasmodiophora brassicae]